MRQYRLLRPVTHRGVYLPAGVIVEYDEPTAAWAAAQGLIMAGGISRPSKHVTPPMPSAPDTTGMFHGVRGNGQAGFVPRARFDSLVAPRRR